MNAGFIVTLAAVFGFLSVAFGAFGAHALKERLDAYSLSIFQTAVQYQFFHALALLALGALFAAKPELLEARGANWAVWGFIAGIVIFSGSLYALALSGVKVLGAVTPVGGVLFLLGWIGVALVGWKARG